MIIFKNYFLLIITILLSYKAFSQQNTIAEDSLQSGNGRNQATYIGGYGDVSYSRDFNLQTAELNLNRAVIFIGHRFSEKISFFSELELEDAKIAGGSPGGEFSLEQAYLKFKINKSNYITAGLFIPRIGLINENHLPVNYHGVERPKIERLIIPATWRELGIGLYGRFNSAPLNYSLAICNGLNSAAFEHGTGIREGRFEGKNATANNMAVTASLQYAMGPIRLQLSGYMGGSVGLSPKQADSLKLKSGLFGNPVVLGEANIQYEHKGFTAKALGTLVSIPDAGDLNRAYANNTPQQMFGAYAEVGYNIIEPVQKWKVHRFIVFIRYEKLDLNDKIPSNGLVDGTLKQDHLIAGFSYLPMNNVVIKADVHLLNTGDQNDALVINPAPNAPEYKKNNTFLNVGLGYSF